MTAVYRDAERATESHIGFAEAVATCFRKYADFTGVATAVELRWFYLFTLLMYGASWMMGLLLVPDYFMVPLLIPVLALLLPTYAVIVRRLRDGGHEWWWLPLALTVPFVWIVVWKFLREPSRPAWQEDHFRPELYTRPSSGA